jgi:hypothetical protein
MYSTTNKIKQFKSILQAIQAVKKPALLASILLLNYTFVQAGEFQSSYYTYSSPVRVYDSERTELRYDPSNGANGTYWVRRFEEVKNDKAVVCPSNRKQNCKFNVDTQITYTKYKTKYLVFGLSDSIPYYGGPISFTMVNVRNDFNSQKYTDPGAVITDSLTVNVNLKPGQRAVPIVYAYVKYIDGFNNSQFDGYNNSKCDVVDCFLRHGIFGYTEAAANGKTRFGYSNHKQGWWKGNVYANWNRGVCILDKNTPSPNPGDAVKNKCLGWNDPEIAIGKWPSRLSNLPYLVANSWEKWL